MDSVRDCNLYEMIYGPSGSSSSSNIDASFPSFTTAPAITTFAPTITSPTVPANNNQILDDWGLDAIVKGFYPTNHLSISPSGFTTTPVTCIPTITNSSAMLLDNHQMLDNTIYNWDPHGFCSNITTQTTPIINNQNWEQHFSSTIGGSFVATAISTTSPSTYHRNWSSQGETCWPQPMNENNVKQLMMQNPNSNVSKTPTLSSKNWPILTIPFLGKITETTTTTTRKQQQQKQNHIFRRIQTQQHSLDISECTKINAQSQSNSNEWKREKRVYKMPTVALNNDVWSWRKYGEKSVEGSPYPRVYYKCNSSKDCAAKRRVEHNRFNPDTVTLKYTGHHNHPNPTFINSSVARATYSGIGIKDDKNTVNSKMSKDDNIYEGLGNLVDLEKST